MKAQVFTPVPRETGPTIQRLDELSAQKQRQRCRHFYNKRRRAQRGHYPDFLLLLDCQIAALWRASAFKKSVRRKTCKGWPFSITPCSVTVTRQRKSETFCAQSAHPEQPCRS